MYFFTHLPMSIVVPWMFVKHNLRTTLIVAALMNAAGSVAKYLVTFSSTQHVVLALTYVAQGLLLMMV